MTRIYRILRKPYAQAPFDGEGAYRYGGRWSSPGTRLSYASEHESLAMLEYFVHLDSDHPPLDLLLASAEIPEDLSQEKIEASELPRNWRDAPAPPALARYGDEFVMRAERCLLLAPSALAPSENNWLINPRHGDFRKLAGLGSEPLIYDRCLFHGGRRTRPHRLK